MNTPTNSVSLDGNAAPQIACDLCLQRLKDETRVQHDQIEQAPLLQGIMQGTLTLADYHQLLRAFYAYYLPLEAALVAYRGEIPQFSARLKSQLLADDCLALGSSREELRDVELCDTLPEVKSAADALGVMYVLEGSTMGGMVIVKRIGKTLPASSVARRFYGGYGRNTHTYWSLYRDALMQHAGSNPSSVDQMVRAAKSTFFSLNEWLGKFKPASGAKQ